ncbi:tol protein, partial [Colletotrichum asianum]
YRVKLNLYYHWEQHSPFRLAFLVVEAPWWTGKDVTEPSVSLQYVRLVFEVETDHQIVQNWLKVPSLRKKQVLCEENIDFMRHANNDCKSSCSHTVASKHLPTRLLDVMPNEKGVVRLLETSEVSSRTELNDKTHDYVALSYCWGSEDDTASQISTTRNILFSRKRDIKEEHLPQTLRDAVHVCRELSIRHLWVDSLCIIQDDIEDWEKESASMGLIYNNALLTIIAASSNSCHDGFLQRERKDIKISFSSRRNLNLSGHFSLVFSGKTYAPHTLDIWWPTRDINDAKWVKRGWTLQEEMMSNRRLIFGQFMVHFQCEAGTKSENGYSSDKTIGSGLSMQSLVRGSTDSTEPSMFRVWHWMLVNYTERSFTIPQDVLPGISGIAGLFASYHGLPQESYLAGIWREDFEYSLIWWKDSEFGTEDFANVQELALTLCNPSPYLAPSWSPLGQRPVTSLTLMGIFSNDFTSDCLIVDASTTATGANPFGQVKYGSFTAEAKFGTVPSEVVPGHCSGFDMTNWQLRENGRVLAYCFIGMLKRTTQKADGLFMMMIGSSNAQKDWMHKVRNVLDYAEDDCSICNFDTEEEFGTEALKNDAMVSADGDTTTKEGSEHDKTENMSPGKQERDYWGILLHRSQTPGQYIRVGAWLSSAYDRRNSTFFEELETRKIVVI